MNDLEQRIKAIEERNKRVELDKSWETSWIRKIIVAILTYAVIVIFFFAAKLPKPFLNSIIPALGFILSTLSLNIFKNWWTKARG